MALYDDQGNKSSKIKKKRAWLLSQNLNHLHELNESSQLPFIHYSYGKVFQCMLSIFKLGLIPIFTLMPLRRLFDGNTF